LKKKQLILGFVVLAALVAIVLWAHDKIPFDMAVFRAQIAQANWWMIALGLACIYAAYLFRSMRWAFLLRHHKKLSPLSLLGTQIIGFTAIALIGRVADPVRAYLVSKKTGLPLSSQFAVYVVERLFDGGAFALILSLALFSVPITITPLTGHEHGFFATHPLFMAYLKRYTGLLATLCGALFLVAVRFYGEKIAQVVQKLLTPLSAKFAHSVAHKIRTFHAGLDIMRSFGDFFWVASMSLLMWGLITASYIVTMRAFTASPELASMNFSKCAGLMLASGGASVLQLPIIGWFTQIAAVAAVLSKLFGVANEAATACAAILLFVTFLGIVPVGLIWAQFEHVNLRKVAVESEVASEHVEEELEEAEEA
jgi:hypothetical protein